MLGSVMLVLAVVLWIDIICGKCKGDRYDR
jgi:hypothetical protein